MYDLMGNMRIQSETPTQFIINCRVLFKAEAIFRLSFAIVSTGHGRWKYTYSKAIYVRRVAAEKIADIPHPM